MQEFNGLETVTCNDASEWESWLANHHELRTAVWQKFAKKGSGITSVTYSEALDIALCYGWIDGQRKGLDETHYLQKFTPRWPKSLWSRVNVAKAETLIASGRMQAPGYAEIAATKADGRWDAAYEPQRNVTVPPRLAAALEQNTRAKAFFDSLNKTDRCAVIWRIVTARTPETREKRLQKAVVRLDAGRVLD